MSIFLSPQNILDFKQFLEVCGSPIFWHQTFKLRPVERNVGAQLEARVPDGIESRWRPEWGPYNLIKTSFTSRKLLGTMVTWVPSGFSGYIWLDTKIVLKKILPNSQRVGPILSFSGCGWDIYHHSFFRQIRLNWPICNTLKVVRDDAPQWSRYLISTGERRLWRKNAGEIT